MPVGIDREPKEFHVHWDWSRPITDELEFRNALFAYQCAMRAVAFSADAYWNSRYLLELMYDALAGVDSIDRHGKVRQDVQKWIDAHGYHVSWEPKHYAARAADYATYALTWKSDFPEDPQEVMLMGPETAFVSLRSFGTRKEEKYQTSLYRGLGLWDVEKRTAQKIGFCCVVCRRLSGVTVGKSDGVTSVQKKLREAGRRIMLRPADADGVMSYSSRVCPSCEEHLTELGLLDEQSESIRDGSWLTNFIEVADA